MHDLRGNDFMRSPEGQRPKRFHNEAASKLDMHKSKRSEPGYIDTMAIDDIISYQIWDSHMHDDSHTLVADSTSQDTM